MEHPVKEIRSVIRSITQGTPDQQRGAVYRYFTPGASFEHPFCRVPSINNVNIPGLGELDSRAVIVAILKWCKLSHYAHARALLNSHAPTNRQDIEPQN
ncbi:hypothetical protein VTK26DRAFT_7938 [Humicola hyalothermophila]